mmetsp:Transcript_139216/g.388479  ORF Transcript_139216/g.388479 Transcript_139216/m.388479 type:complete len:133 (+) Transcript_139216:85-483(+)
MGWGGGGKGGWGGGKDGWASVWQPMFQKQPWGKGGGKGKNKGKGHKDFKFDQKVWIGGIPEGVTFKELLEHLKPAGAKFAMCFDGNGQGTGVACFASAEEAQNAIATMQGSSLNGAALELDVWERKPKQEQA